MSGGVAEWSPGGVLTRSQYDNATGEMVITRMQNVQPILDYAHQLRSLGASHYKGETGDLWHYARVPTIFLEKWIKEYGADRIFKEDDSLIIQLIERDFPKFKVGEFSLA